MIWINGPFGGGKSTTAEALVARRPELRIFDPEHVGYLLVSNLRGIRIDDFQDLTAWRELVPVVARHVSETCRQRLVATQTVSNREYWGELRAGLAGQGMPVHHVTLDIDRATLEQRIKGDEAERDARQWRLDHIDTYLEAREWLIQDSDLVVDTTHLDVDEVAATIDSTLT